MEMIALIHASLPKSPGLAHQVFTKANAAIRILLNALPKPAIAAAAANEKNSRKTRNSNKPSNAELARLDTVARLKAFVTEIENGMEETDIKNKMFAVESCLVKMKAALYAFIFAWSHQPKRGIFPCIYNQFNFFPFSKCMFSPIIFFLEPLRKRKNYLVTPKKSIIHSAVISSGIEDT